MVALALVAAWWSWGCCYASLPAALGGEGAGHLSPADFHRAVVRCQSAAQGGAGTRAPELREGYFESLSFFGDKIRGGT